MRKSLRQSGRHTILPIVDDELVEVCIRSVGSPELVFADTEGQQAIIVFEDEFQIGRGTHRLRLRHLEPFNMAPLVELVGTTVTDALATAEGRLELSFSNAVTLECSSTTGYEAWHFYFPRPARPLGGDLSHYLSVHGTGSGLA